MKPTDIRDPAALLAASFAARLVAWARQQLSVISSNGAGLTKSEATLLFRAGWRVSKATSDGHVCVTLDDILRQVDTSSNADSNADTAPQAAASQATSKTPSKTAPQQDWLDNIASIDARQVADVDTSAPAMMDGADDEFDEAMESAFLAAFSGEALAESSGETGDETRGETRAASSAASAEGGTITDAAKLRALLLRSGVVGTPDAPGTMPLILDSGNRLYLHKYFDFEKRLARRLLQHGQQRALPDDRVRNCLAQLFEGNQSGSGPDWQKIGAALALLRPVTIISGGPGTGKTTTVARLLGCLLTENPQSRIALAAPTGKAAARMLDALRSRAQHLPPQLRELLPNDSYTVHRLLGVTPKAGVFRHHAGNPLAVDVLVIDEASMLDLALAARLFDAVPPGARIILLGDKDQLAAVEAGAVFSELSSDPSLNPDTRDMLADMTGIPAAQIMPPPAIEKTGFSDAVVWFTYTHRFAKESAVGQLAASIVAGDDAATMALLREETKGAASTHARWLDEQGDGLSALALEQMVAGYQPYVTALQHSVKNGALDAGQVYEVYEVFEAFERFRVLCAIRATERGVDAINRHISGRLRTQLSGLGSAASVSASAWYAGRPVLILRNDYNLKLFNGDIGITLPDENNALMVYFPDKDKNFRMIAPARLPEHETAFAMTVHKSQGSEFAQVMVVLPAEDSRVVTRELLYTGVTRASERVAVVGSEQRIMSAVQNRTRRVAGLAARLAELRLGDLRTPGSPDA